MTANGPGTFAVSHAERNMPDPCLLPIGKIRKAHGIRGEVSVDYYAGSPDLLSGGVYLQHGSGTPVFHEVVSCRAHHGNLLVRFAKASDRTGAELLRGSDILVPEDRLPEPDDGEIYLHEVLGLNVIAVDEKGVESHLGAITDINDSSGQELWTISETGREDVLFPAAPEFVLEFDLASRTVRIAPPPGLIDLYRS